MIEEIGRIYGYARIPMHRGAFAMDMRGRMETDFDPHRGKQVLVDRGYQEVITYSFVSPGIQQLIDPGLEPTATQIRDALVQLEDAAAELGRYARDHSYGTAVIPSAPASTIRWSPSAAG